MAKLSTNKFKLLLSIDLIVLILEIFTHGKTNQDQEEMINLILDRWSTQIDESSNKIKKQYVKELLKNKKDDDIYLTEDVAMIMMDINVMDKQMFKKELIEQIQKEHKKRLEKSKS